MKICDHEDVPPRSLDVPTINDRPNLIDLSAGSSTSEDYLMAKRHVVDIGSSIISVSVDLE